MSQKSLIQGPVMKTMLLFALPLVLGDLLQQCYNIADTLVVSRAIGPDALAAVGSAFTLMTFLTSILLGLCLGSGAVFSMRFGEGDGRNEPKKPDKRSGDEDHAAFRSALGVG